jgi:hypothetical protein
MNASYAGIVVTVRLPLANRADFNVLSTGGNIALTYALSKRW